MEWQTWNLGSDDRDEVEKLRKEADNNIDVIAAYTIQIKEVFENYVGWHRMRKSGSIGVLTIYL